MLLRRWTGGRRLRRGEKGDDQQESRLEREELRKTEGRTEDDEDLHQAHAEEKTIYSEHPRFSSGLNRRVVDEPETKGSEDVSSRTRAEGDRKHEHQLVLERGGGDDEGDSCCCGDEWSKRTGEMMRGQVEFDASTPWVALDSRVDQSDGTDQQLKTNSREI